MEGKQSTDKKINLLHDALYVLLYFIFLLLVITAEIKISPYLMVISFFVVLSVPEFLRRKKQYKK